MNSFVVDDYKLFAEKARRELKTDPRQAVEKAYLSAVHAARQIIRCSNVEWKSSRRMSAAAIGRANQLIGERIGRTPDTRIVTEAFSKALGQHTACFYEGVCSQEEAKKTVKSMLKATKAVDRLCNRLATV